jgi:capsid protein
VARGYVNLPGYFQNPLAKSAYLRCTWVGQAKGSLDPLKETNSAILQIKEGIKTRQQITLEMTGGDWEENIAAIKRENEILKEAGLTQTTGVIEYEETDSEDDKEKSKFRSRVNI